MSIGVLIAVLALLAGLLGCACSGDQPGRLTPSNSPTHSVTPVPQWARDISPTCQSPAPSILEPQGTPLGRPYELYVISSQSGHSTLHESSSYLPRVMWSPDGGHFAHFPGHLQAQSTQVHFVDPSATPTEGVVEVSGAVESLTWSPDGRKLALTSRVGRHQTLMVIESSSASAQELDSRIASFVGPFEVVSWLTQDSILVFERCDQASGLPVVYGLGNMEPRRFDIRPIGSSSVEVSPNRTAIAWVDHCGYPGINDGLWTLDLESGKAKLISEACRLTDLSWSHDSREIAYTGLDGHDAIGTSDDSGGLYALNLESEMTRRLTNPAGAEEVRVEWRPDDDGFLLYRNFRPGCAGECPPSKLILVSLDGNEIIIEEHEKYPKDERGALFESDEGLKFLSADGSEERVLFGAHEEWRFIQPELSPDGHWVTVVRYHCGDCTFP